MTSYLKFAGVLALNTVAMYLLTFSMIRRTEDFFVNLSNFYMALMMVAPMAILMLLVMPSMFPKKALNYALMAGFAVLFVAVFAAGRTQAAIGDKQFLKAMIPHHSRAVLACQESKLDDPKVVELCGQIVESQEREIRQMKQMLTRY